MFSRTEKLINHEGMERLRKANIILFGIGGVGGYVAEALIRTGISQLTIVDGDVVTESNFNRQIIATQNVIGQTKVHAMEQRLLSINPNAQITPVNIFFLQDSNNIGFAKYDYIIDAVDTVTAKLELAKQAQLNNVPLISAMGAGNKLDATKFLIDDIKRTSVCSLARVMRRELRKKHGITHLKVVYSKEEAVLTSSMCHELGSVAHCVGVAGLLLAGEVINDIIFQKGCIPY